MSGKNDFVIGNGTLLKYNGEDAEVVIPDGITTIGEDAFRDCNSLVKVSIPDGVKTIKYEAFWNCENLTEITIPDSVTHIEDGAFNNCTNLKKVCVSNLTKYLNIQLEGSVWRNVDLFFLDNAEVATDIVIPDGVESIGESQFSELISLRSIALPDSVKSIGWGAFANSTNLASVNLPEGIKKIEDYLFWGCRSITTLAIPDSVTSIGENAFNGCSSLKCITIPKRTKKLGWAAFSEPTVIILNKYKEGIEKQSIAHRFAFCKTPLGEIKSVNAKTLAVKGFLTVDSLEVYDDKVIDSYKKYLKGKVNKYEEFILENDTAFILNRLVSLGLMDNKLANTLLKRNIPDTAKNILEDFINANSKADSKSPLEEKKPSVTELKKSWSFDKNENGITITSYKGAGTIVEVPDKIGTAPVIEIGVLAFSRRANKINRSQAEVRQKITSIALPDTVRVIGEGAFA